MLEAGDNKQTSHFVYENVAHRCLPVHPGKPGHRPFLFRNAESGWQHERQAATVRRREPRAAHSVNVNVAMLFLLYAAAIVTLLPGYLVWLRLARRRGDRAGDAARGQRAEISAANLAAARACVDVIVAMHDEAAGIEEKLRNLAALEEPGEIRDLLARIIAAKDAGAPVLFSSQSYRRTIAWPDYTVERENRPGEPSPCTAGTYFLQQEPNGDVYPCVLQIGSFQPKNVLRDGAEAAWKHTQSHSCFSCYNTWLNENRAVFDLSPAVVSNLWRNYMRSRKQPAA